MPPSLILQAPVPASGHPWAQTVPGILADKPALVSSVALPSLRSARGADAGFLQGLQGSEEI